LLGPWSLKVTEPGDHRSLRIIVDANVLISHLIGRGKATSAVGELIRIIFTPTFEVMVPRELIGELRSLREKKHLASRIPEWQVENFVAALRLMGRVVDSGTPRRFRGLRDRGDDYLLTAAIRHEVDILVSGDKDLLVMARFLELPRIMSPAQFVAEFGEG
jgi:putative PIN family toxin of toxin-antitoxin system